MSGETQNAVMEARTTGSGQTVQSSIKLIGFDQPFFTALAVTLALFSFMFCFMTTFLEGRRVYFTQRCEAYLEQAVTNHQTVVPYKICGPRDGDKSP